MNPILIAILAVIAIAVIATITYYLIRFSKGSIKLHMAKTSFNPGDIISGQFALATKKEIQGNKLVVRLIGKKVIRTTDHDGDRNTRTEEFYRDEVILEDKKRYPAGTNEKHRFEIPAPTAPSSNNENIPGFLQNISSVASFMSDRSVQLKWKIEVRLDAKGVDLATSESVNINFRQLF